MGSRGGGGNGGGGSGGSEWGRSGRVHEGEGVANVILEKAGALDKVARVRTLTLLDRRDAEGADTGA